MQRSNWLFIPLLLSLLISLLLSGPVAAREHTQTQQQKIELHRDAPAPGGHKVQHSQSARVTATINGHQSIEYLIDARTGQSLQLDLHSSNTQAGYRITAPAAPRALHRGHGQHARFSITLPRDGTYRVLVYLLKGAAKNGESADFALDIRLSDPG